MLLFWNLHIVSTAFFVWILKPVFRNEIGRQVSVYFETQQTVIQFTPIDDYSFAFTEGSFLLLNGQKHLRSVAEDLISNNNKKLNEFIDPLTCRGKGGRGVLVGPDHHIIDYNSKSAQSSTSKLCDF